MPKLVLFDIDETMISSNGAGRRAIGRLLRERHPITEEHMAPVAMSGKTDPQIIREVLSAIGVPEKEIQETVDATAERYIEILREEIENAGYYIVHEGVTDLIAAVVKHADLYLGLLTGNVEKGARLKLEQFGLNTHFPMGAYGSDSGNRLDLPAIACQRALEQYGIKFQPHDVVIIGDAVNDILCARGYDA
ncbi:MAG TPA: HAD family hydrolase, partial [Chroococcales cyanobacterium]